jgi:hypothetical protein
MNLLISEDWRFEMCVTAMLQFNSSGSRHRNNVRRRHC